LGLVRYALKSCVLKFKPEGELSPIWEKFGIRLETLQRQAPGRLGFGRPIFIDRLFTLVYETPLDSDLHSRHFFLLAPNKATPLGMAPIKTAGVRLAGVSTCVPAMKFDNIADIADFSEAETADRTRRHLRFHSRQGACRIWTFGDRQAVLYSQDGTTQ